MGGQKLGKRGVWFRFVGERRKFGFDIWGRGKDEIILERNGVV